MQYIFSFLTIVLFLGCQHNNDDMDELSLLFSEVNNSCVYYGDVNSDTVLTIDIQEMQLLNVLASSGLYPYEIAPASESTLYVINRKDYNIGVFNAEENSIDTTLSLNFMPRSVAISGNDLLISSADEPSAAIMSNEILSLTYHDSLYSAPTSYGGTNATGHPVWIDETYFLLLDRTQNSIELYQKGIMTPVSKLITHSSTHHVLNRDGYFYAIAEGKQNGVAPGVVKFTIANGEITLIKERVFSDLANLPTDFTTATWGAHHGALHPDFDYIYVGSAEGNVFVLDLAQLDLVDTFVSGKGVGHILFYDDMLITTNHYDNFKSFYNASNPKDNMFIKNLYFSDTTYDGITMQSHTSHIVEGKLHFTFNSDTQSTLYKLDLERIEIEDSLQMPGRYLLMGSFLQNSTLVDHGM